MLFTSKDSRNGAYSYWKLGLLKQNRLVLTRIWVKKRFYSFCILLGYLKIENSRMDYVKCRKSERVWSLNCRKTVSNVLFPSPFAKTSEASVKTFVLVLSKILTKLSYRKYFKFFNRKGKSIQIGRYGKQILQKLTIPAVNSSLRIVYAEKHYILHHLNQISSLPNCGCCVIASHESAVFVVVFSSLQRMKVLCGWVLLGEFTKVSQYTQTQ